MSPSPDDFFTGPEDVDPDTLPNRGPLKPLTGPYPGWWFEVLE